MPYDEFVYAMISSEGDAWASDSSPVGYYSRDNRMLQDNLSNTMQVFLGTQMACAQCHDHPFDKWTQMDFFKLAAFTNGTASKQRQQKSYKKCHQNGRHQTAVKEKTATFKEHCSLPWVLASTVKAMATFACLTIILTKMPNQVKSSKLKPLLAIPS